MWRFLHDGEPHSQTTQADLRKYVAINTCKGLFRYTQLPYRILSALGIFQKEMDNLLAGIPGFVIYLENILVMGAHFDPQLPLILACDASAFGTVLAHLMPDGSEKSIEYASRTGKGRSGKGRSLV